MNTVCRVLDWQSAVDWTQPHLIAASVGPAKDSHAGRQQTAFPKFYRQRVQTSAILPSLLTRVIPVANNRFVLLDTILTARRAVFFPGHE